MNSFTYTKGELCWEYDKLETCMSRPEDKGVKITNMDQYSIYTGSWDAHSRALAKM